MNEEKWQSQTRFFKENIVKIPSRVYDVKDQ